ncbi:MAG: DUF4340 domain-containing protein [Kiritimatiellae bacterium]|nr:DUF4340 domain-containing protein [Kiritimatiellia bacterium]
MKARTLTVLIIVLLVLVGVIWLTERSAKDPLDMLSSGDSVLGEFDANQIVRVKTIAVNQTNEISQKDVWVSSSLYEYPIDFNKLQREIVKLTDLKVGQIIHGGTETLSEFGLSLEANNDERLDLYLYDKEENKLAQITFGKSRFSEAGGRGNFPQGQYIRANDGPVILVDESFIAFPKTAQEWLDQNLLSINVADLTAITVSSGSDAYTLSVKSANTYVINDLKADEEIQTTEASRLARSFQNLQFVSVADPSKKDLGFDQPDSIAIQTKEGFTYTLLVSEKDEKNNAYVRIRVDYEQPATPTEEEVALTIPEDPVVPEDSKTEEGKEEDASAKKTREEKIQEAYQLKLSAYKKKCAEDKEQAQAENKTFSPWTYTLPNLTVDSITLAREKLVKKKEREEEEVGGEPAS